MFLRSTKQPVIDITATSGKKYLQPVSKAAIMAMRPLPDYRKVLMSDGGVQIVRIDNMVEKL